MSDYIKYMYREYLEGRSLQKLRTYPRKQCRRVRHRIDCLMRSA